MEVKYREPDKERIKEIDEALKDKSERKEKKMVKKYFGLWEWD